MANAQDIKWSKTEKTIARRAFESAYGTKIQPYYPSQNLMVLDGAGVCFESLGQCLMISHIKSPPSPFHVPYLSMSDLDLIMLYF